MQTQAQVPTQEMENFSYSCTCISLAFASTFHTCEQGQRNATQGKKKHTHTHTHSVRFHATTASLVRHLGKTLPLRLRNLPSLRLRSTCELRLHLCRTCEPGFTVSIPQLDGEIPTLSYTPSLTKA